ncbi:MAG: M24 family metallopeptidase [Bacillota bacterium]
MNHRLHALRAKMSEQSLPALLVMKDANRVYVSGFTGSSGILIVTAQAAVLITDGRYTEQATLQAPDFRVITHTESMVASVRQALGELGIDRAGFERDYWTVAQYETWGKALAPVELVGVEGLVEGLRRVKDAEEIRRMRQAQAITDQAFRHILDFIQPGMKETDVALELEYTMKKLGAEDLSFETIAASGPRSALPHGRASDRVLQKGDFLTLDFGCMYQGYCSDMTRTVMIGEPSEKQREIYDIVLQAQKAGVEAVRPGVSGRDVDRACRDIIAAYGYGEAFSHSTGHGVGLMIHEGPAASVRSDDVLQPGMMVTIEPGIYIAGFGGVRIEDLVLVTETGHDVLGNSPKDLIIL